jgi:hypothetical protein
VNAAQTKQLKSTIRSAADDLAYILQPLLDEMSSAPKHNCQSGDAPCGAERSTTSIVVGRLGHGVRTLWLGPAGIRKGRWNEGAAAGGCCGCPLWAEAGQDRVGMCLSWQGRCLVHPLKSRVCSPVDARTPEPRPKPHPCPVSWLGLAGICRAAHINVDKHAHYVVQCLCLNRGAHTG